MLPTRQDRPVVEGHWEVALSQAVAAARGEVEVVHPPAIPLREAWPWLVLGLALLAVVYVVGLEEGAVSILPGRAIHVVMIAISLLAAVAAVHLRRTLRERHGAEVAALLAAGLYLVVVALAGVALPAVDEVPAGFPASTLVRFREASVGMQAVPWGTIGLVFAATARRVMAGLPLFPRGVR
jgi:hypothetical protein